MEIFHCEAPADMEIPMYEGNCDDIPTEAKICNKVISLWVSK
jgi:dopamine beta-monooxygenase